MIKDIIEITLENSQITNNLAISDTHFDHENIIRYCRRPFPNVKAMNTAILRNLRRVIRPDSLVFFLGDMSYGRGSRPVWWWLRQLPGRIVYIRGNHEKGSPTGSNVVAVADAVKLTVGDVVIFFTHNPDDIPDDWSGWAVHGHKHDTRPFIDKVHRRINVSVDVTGYRPVRLSEIIGIIKSSAPANRPPA